ncbi:MAG: RNA 2',3'-cyclic phosphodiesterase [Ignavibacteriaceae bacterium]
MIRLFIALKIPDDIKKQIITFRNEIHTSSIKLKWEPEEKLHLTLKFIGEVPGNILDEIISSVSFINEYRKFLCSFTGFGFFYKKRDPKILWAGFRVEDSLIELAARLNMHFTSFSIPAEDRKFKAHLTLLRIRDRGNVDGNFIDGFEKFTVNEIPFFADEIVLIKSDLLPSGSKYTEIKNFKLK